MKDSFNENTQELAIALMHAIRAHYMLHQPGQQHVFEVLNALAVVSAMVVAPLEPQTGRTTPLKFFFNAFRAQVRLVREHEQEQAAKDAEPNSRTVS